MHPCPALQLPLPPSPALRLPCTGYIVAGALMALDDAGFLSVEDNPDPQKGAEKVMAFAKVGHDDSDMCGKFV